MKFVNIKIFTISLLTISATLLLVLVNGSPRNDTKQLEGESIDDSGNLEGGNVGAEVSKESNELKGHPGGREPEEKPREANRPDSSLEPPEFVEVLSQQELTPARLTELLPSAREEVARLATIVLHGSGREPLRSVRALGTIGSIYADIAPSVLDGAEGALLSFYERERDIRAKIMALDAIALISSPQESTISMILQLPPDDPALGAKLYSILPRWFQLEDRARALYVEALGSMDSAKHSFAVYGISAAIDVDPS